MRPLNGSSTIDLDGIRLLATFFVEQESKVERSTHVVYPGVEKDKPFRVNGASLSIEHLSIIAESVAAVDPDQPFVLSLDPDLPMDYVPVAMEVLNSHGLNQMVFRFGKEPKRRYQAEIQLLRRE